MVVELLRFVFATLAAPVITCALYVYKDGFPCCIKHVSTRRCYSNGKDLWSIIVSYHSTISALLRCCTVTHFQ